MRLLIFLLATVSMANAMALILGVGQAKRSPQPQKGDWPARFPQHPAGFDYKCKNRQFGLVTLPPSAPAQQIQRDIVDVVTTTHVVTTKPTTTHAPTTTVKPTSTTTLKPTVPTTTAKPADKPTGTTFWIRSPTPPNTPAPVVRGGAAYTLGPPQAHTVKILAPHAPDKALDPFAMSSDDDFEIKPVGTPKAPRKVVDPDA
ncbi:unnamed protein product [Caenorhabditis nigoni]